MAPSPSALPGKADDRRSAETVAKQTSVGDVVLRFGLAAVALLALGSETKTAAPVVGWIEKIRIEPFGHILEAKVDTGADTSSLHAEEIERFEKDGREWVSFRLEVESDGEEDLEVRITRPVVRNVRIVRGNRPSERRPVVMISFCLGAERHEAQFTLRDRSRFSTPVLLGRRFLSKATMIDPARKHLTELECDPGEDGKRRETALREEG